ncbi:APC family permease [Mycoplasmopsis agassizii]|uniref:Amino acid permease n=1 Tax=Mycoplasmopsis agassizii TaxID=33922 RepID=A0ABX4H4M4_9BACT|nr:amino acid permease [Mycoplasmopsis agassizii]PAF54844.1 amino acid permease [Mycoplasmopsis agassizii]SMC18609.1 Amino acid transporter [Mycoplasmopsis agassizii]
MSQKSVRKIGMLVAISLVVGSIIGIGIFFKNGSVSRTSSGESITWLLAWFVGGIIALFSALSFSEISSLKVKKLVGISSWAYQNGGKRYGYFVAYGWSFFYWGILLITLGSFSSEILVAFLAAVADSATAAAINSAVNHAWFHFIIGIILTFAFLGLNIIDPTVSGIFATVTTGLKLIPLVIAIVVGIVFVNQRTITTNGVTETANAFVTHPQFSFQKMILALPGVLFAFDAFLSVGSARSRMKNDGKQLPLVIFFGMVIVLVIYVLIAISSILQTQGNIGGLISISLGGSNEWVTGFVFFFIFISTLGLLNGLTGFMIQDYSRAVQTRLSLGSDWLIKNIRAKFNGRDISHEVRALVLIAIYMLLWLLPIWLPAFIFNSDAFLDGATNWPTLLFFFNYAIIMGLYAYKRFKGHFKEGEIKKINNVVFYGSTIIAISLIAVAVIAFIYSTVSTAAIDPEGSASWGLFADGGFKATNFLRFILFIAFTFIMLLAPFVNALLIKAIEKRDVIEDLAKLEEGVDEKTPSLQVKQINKI